MMRKLAVSILLFFLSSSSFSQQTATIHSWEKAQTMHPDSVFHITFAHVKMDSLPEELKKFKQLRTLNLSKTKLNRLPSWIKSFEKLEELDLSRNEFKIFPAPICDLTTLKKLSFNRNDFEWIPDCIVQLQTLEYIDIWSTPVSDFPLALTKMPNLKKLDARGIMHGPKFQNKWNELLPWVKIEFDAPCNCLE